MKLLNVLEASLNEIYIFDSQMLRFEYVNEGARRNLGYSMETLLTLSPIDLKPEYTEASFRKMVEPLFLGQKEKLIFQTMHRRADGSLYPIEVHLQLVEYEARTLFLSIINDITERKRAEENLGKLSQAVNQSANAIVITNINGEIEYANPKFVEVSGYSLSEVLGKTPRILNSGEHSAEFYRNLWQTIKAGTVWRGEIHNRRKDGTLYWEDCTITPIFDLMNRLVNFIAVKEDITARRLLEEAERNQRQLAEALRDTLTALSSSLKLEEVLDRVLENIAKLITFDASMVLLVEGYSVRQIRYRSKNPEELINQTAVGDTQAHLINFPILQEMREIKLPCLIADTQADPRWRAIPGIGWVRSFISAPIIIRGHVAGIINILSATPGFFTSAHTKLLMVFSEQSAVAIENAQLFEQAYFLSVTDPLTELTNRRRFFEIGRLEFERAHRYERTLSVMMVDVDHFKRINDTLGHAVGDLALREIATRIKQIVRTVDIVARFGGEEFIVLMPETELDEACRVAERVRHAVSDIPIEKDAYTFCITLSIGVAEIRKASMDIDELIRCADQALYEAKAAGRNRVLRYQNA
jgi:diguanylate cyclase (GGDEF)-like protein/PAS domain S-box-containing protein